MPVAVVDASAGILCDQVLQPTYFLFCSSDVQFFCSACVPCAQFAWSSPVSAEVQLRQHEMRFCARLRAVRRRSQRQPRQWLGLQQTPPGVSIVMLCFCKHSMSSVSAVRYFFIRAVCYVFVAAEHYKKDKRKVIHTSSWSLV